MRERDGNLNGADAGRCGVYDCGSGGPSTTRNPGLWGAMQTNTQPIATPVFYTVLGTASTPRELPGAQPAAAPSGAEGAVEGADGATPGGQQQATPVGGLTWLWPIMIGMLALMIFTSFSGQRKEKKRREAMMSAMGKHDRVQTAGGIIGTIVEMKGDEVVLRVDESSNTRIRFAKSSIQQVLKSAGKGGVEQEADSAEDKDAA